MFFPESDRFSIEVFILLSSHRNVKALWAQTVSVMFPALSQQGPANVVS